MTLFSGGKTDSSYTLPEDTALSLQQAVDLAIDTMLKRSGLTKEAFLQYTLLYGYYDKSNFAGDTSVWRFVWFIDQYDAATRYWVDFDDVASPMSIRFSAPGAGLG